MKKVLTYHVHGSYLYYLSKVNCLFYLPVKTPPSPPFLGKTAGFAWGDNVVEVPVEKISQTELDCIIFQSNFNPKEPDRDYLKEQTEILSKYQLKHVKKIFLEHDPPRGHPTDTKHCIKNPNTTIVHVTPFNDLNWDCGRVSTTVIDHGVQIPANIKYTGRINKGIAAINNLPDRGRRLGLDIFEKVKTKIPIDLVGTDSEKLGGLGEIAPKDLPLFISKYRFFFNPTRYTSLGLSVIEAMMTGMPVVSLATTEHAVAIKDSVRGFSSTNINYLIKKMRLLLQNQDLGQMLGRNGQQYAQKRFNIERFKKNWQKVIEKT